MEIKKNIKEFSIVKDCCICNSNKLSMVLDLGKTSLANNLVDQYEESLNQKTYDLGLLICQECNHIQLNTEINPKILFNNYVYKTGISKTMLNHFHDFSNKLCKYFNIKKRSYSDIKVLDIGSNDCALLNILRSKGFQTFGVEPSSKLADNSSHKIFNGYFNEESANKIKNQYGLFDVITANNVFAHTRDLNQFIRNTCLLLKSDGLVSMEVQYLPKLMSNCYIDMIYHEHTSYHHFKPLNNLFFKNSLTVNSVSEIDTHGGSMRIVLNNYSKNIIPFDNNETSQDFIKSDTKFNDNIVEKFDCLRIEVENLRFSLNKTIKELTNKYPLLFGYSAPAKTVTLLSLLDKDIIDKIEFIIEDNDLKQGRYIPSTKIPLIGSNNAIEKMKNKKSACIIFAWNMFDEISKKIINNTKLNPNVLISPLPSPTIIQLK